MPAQLPVQPMVNGTRSWFSWKVTSFFQVIFCLDPLCAFFTTQPTMPPTKKGKKIRSREEAKDYSFPHQCQPKSAYLATGLVVFLGKKQFPCKLPCRTAGRRTPSKTLFFLHRLKAMHHLPQNAIHEMTLSPQQQDRVTGNILQMIVPVIRKGNWNP